MTRLTAYLGIKQTPQSQTMMTKYSGANAGPTLAPNIMISFASAYTLAPMVPAYFLLKSGFEDLNAERTFAYHKEYAKTAIGQVPANGPAPTYAAE